VDSLISCRDTVAGFAAVFVEAVEPGGRDVAEWSLIPARSLLSITSQINRTYVSNFASQQLEHALIALDARIQTSGQYPKNPPVFWGAKFVEKPANNLHQT